ncbi:MAG: hypothetical protein DDT26_00030 [Dehalococcoidia bacterium]|nr:hypothetical protein [Chloroflexota bacterium]
MTTLVNAILDFDGRRRIINLGDAQAPQEPATLAQLQSAIEGISWKDSVRAASVANINVSSPGAAVDVVTLAVNDRVLLKNQAAAAQNGIYIFNGAAAAMTRSLDANTFGELEAARVRVEEGATNGSTEWAQTAVNGTIGTSDVVWVAGGTAAPPASTTTPGVIELATQAEVDAGVASNLAVTPETLAAFVGRARRSSATIGDGAATSVPFIHNLGTEDVQVYVRETGGLKREVFCQKQHTNVNTITLLFDTAPALNSLRVTVLA